MINKKTNERGKIFCIVLLMAIVFISTGKENLLCMAYDENNEKLLSLNVINYTEKLAILDNDGFVLKENFGTIGFIKKNYTSLFVQIKKSWKGLFNFYMESASNFENLEFPVSGKIYLENIPLSNSVVFLKSKGKVKQIVTGPDGVFVSSATKKNSNILYYINYDTNEWYFLETDLDEDSENILRFARDQKILLSNEIINQKLLNIQFVRDHSTTLMQLNYSFERKGEITFYFSPNDFILRNKFSPTFYELDGEAALYISSVENVKDNRFDQLRKMIATIQYPQVKVSKSGIIIKDAVNKGLKTAVLINSDGYEYCKLVFENEISIPLVLKDESATMLYSVYPDIPYDTVLNDFSLYNFSEICSIQIIIPIN